jgi:molybdopterin converting factor subunit 1
MKILYFAQIARALGRREDELHATEPLDADALWNRLLELRPELAPYRATVHLARNHEYPGARELFTDRDEVALIPPVSGG